MKSTGITRKVDELGRIVIPIELRRSLGIAIRDSLEISVEGEFIVLKKHENACIFCSNESDIVEFKGKNICKRCHNEIKA